MSEFLTPILITVIYIIIWVWWREEKRIKRKNYYRKYLKSDAWKRKRYVVLKRDNWTCKRCGAKAEQVHHKKYARNIGTEPIKWLESICKDCHYKIHNKSTKLYFKTSTFFNKSKPVQSKKTISNKPKGLDLIDNYITAIESKYPDNSLQTNWSWSVKMNLCPKSNSKDPLIDYYNNIEKDKVFCEDLNNGNHPKGLDTYHKKWKVIQHNFSDKKDKLWVIIENFDLSIRYLLIEITFLKKVDIRIYKKGWVIESRSNVFLHDGVSRSFASYDGAKKMLFEKQGKEWIGGETIDDWL